MSRTRTLTQELKAEAQCLGFSLVGVTSSDPPPHAAFYERWLADGHQAGMAYLAEERAVSRRADPRLILPDCRSILVLGVRYPRPYDRMQAEGPDLTGRVAAYAWGEDYHLILPSKLAELVAFIEEKVGRPIPNRYYTDTGPILERDLAQRAGLGWIGKNTCLINPRKGSYFLLAEILLGIELELDQPLDTDHCGSCTRCIEACPTGCILPNRILDAGRCISYLTIENKGEIPVELQAATGDWVFGCDICQQVCPWNRFASDESNSAFAPRAGVPLPNLIEEISLTPEAFNKKFKDSPIKRTKRRGYLRNVAVALGNSGNSKAIPALEAAMNDPEPLVRQHVAQALEKLKHKDT